MGLKNLVNLKKFLPNYLDEILDSSFDGIVISDSEASILKVNKAYLKLSGLHKEDIVGHNLKQLLNDGILTGAVVFEVTKTGVQTTMVHDYPQTGRTAMVTGNPVFDKHGNLIYVLANFRDITQLRKIGKKLGYSIINEFGKKTLYIKSELADLPNFGILLHNKKMKALLKQALQVAKFDSHVLLLGESGVGKTKFAEIIHKAGPRSSKPFVSINCGAIPESLLESELFGYVKGAFTGANTKGKTGQFESASGGTILLDEIGDLSLNLQTKLLQVIEEKKILKVGSTTPLNINVRIIAATHENLREMVSQNKFREDLYFRINVAPIMIPPLRERLDEIPQFVRYFFDHFNKQYGTLKFPSPELISELYQYDFPGNVRELKNLIERLLIMSQTDLIDTNNLSLLWPERRQEPSHLDLNENHTLKQFLKKCESLYIEKVLKEKNNYNQASERLGISNTTLWRKMKMHRLVGKTKIQ